MKTPIDVQSRRFTLTRALRRHVARRLEFVSGERFDDIRRITVRLSDDNGPRGGDDKRCLIRARLPGNADVVVTETRGDLYAAIDRAATRLRRAVGRRLTRRQQLWRGKMQRSEEPAQAADERGIAFG